jgi:hypothetical protein
MYSRIKCHEKYPITANRGSPHGELLNDASTVPIGLLRPLVPFQLFRPELPFGL